MKTLPTEKTGAKITAAHVLYVFIFAASVGGLFSLLFVALIPGQEIPISFPVLLLPLSCALFSGCCGVLGMVLDDLLARLGLMNEVLLRILGYIGTIASIFIFVFLIAWSTGYLEKLLAFFSHSIWFILLGCFFGGIAGVIEYFYTKLGGKVKTLSHQNRLLVELAEKERELAEKTKTMAVMEERNRMARDLHDSISQGIHGIIYSCHPLKKYLTATSVPVEARNIIEHIEKTAGLTLNELRAMILELRPTLIESQGLVEALRVSTELFSWRQEAEIVLDLDYVAGLPPEPEIAVYRIVQEALANTRKHAAASRIYLALREKEDYVELTVTDNGTGFDPENVKLGNGLLNMKTRAQDNGGVFRLQTAPGKGTTITVTFPKTE
jgi:glucose-6-phosphate-specific signal transduction histidine kinase